MRSSGDNLLSSTTGPRLRGFFVGGSSSMTSAAAAVLSLFNFNTAAAAAVSFSCNSRIASFFNWSIFGSRSYCLMRVRRCFEFNWSSIDFNASSMDELLSFVGFSTASSPSVGRVFCVSISFLVSSFGTVLSLGWAFLSSVVIFASSSFTASSLLSLSSSSSSLSSSSDASDSSVASSSFPSSISSIVESAAGFKFDSLSIDNGGLASSSATESPFGFRSWNRLINRRCLAFQVDGSCFNNSFTISSDSNVLFISFSFTFDCSFSTVRLRLAKIFMVTVGVLGGGRPFRKYDFCCEKLIGRTTTRTKSAVPPRHKKSTNNNNN